MVFGKEEWSCSSRTTLGNYVMRCVLYADPKYEYVTVTFLSHCVISINHFIAVISTLRASISNFPSTFSMKYLISLGKRC
jgi:hypothetical protein